MLCNGPDPDGPDPDGPDPDGRFGHLPRPRWTQPRLIPAIVTTVSSSRRSLTSDGPDPDGPDPI